MIYYLCLIKEICLFSGIWWIRWIIRILRSQIWFQLECRPRILRKSLWTPRISWRRRYPRILLCSITWRSSPKGLLPRWWWWWLRCWSHLWRRSWIPLTRIFRIRWILWKKVNFNDEPYRSSNGWFTKRNLRFTTADFFQLITNLIYFIYFNKLIRLLFISFTWVYNNP